MNKKNIILDIENSKKVIDFTDEKYKTIKTLDIGRLPFLDVEIYFSQDIWDFNDYKPHMGKHKNYYDFSALHYAYKDYVKAYILECIVNNKHSSTINKYFGYISKIVKFLEESYVYDPSLISLNCINSFNKMLEERFRTENERIHNRRLFIRLLTYIERSENVDYSQARKKLSENDTALLKEQIENGKTPNIPTQIYNRIIACSLKEINRNDTSNQEKLEASFVLLLSQVGMRILEMSLLEAGKKDTKECFNGTKKVPYLEYLTVKTVKNVKGTKDTKTFLTQKAELAYDMLERLTKDKREACKLNYIFINPSKLKPKSTKTLENMLIRFIVRNSQEIGVVNREFDGFRIFTRAYNKKNKVVGEDYYKYFSDTDIIAIPTPHQFRVAVCNELIRNGCQLEWVVEHMNHMSMEMTSHYKRNDTDSEEGKKIGKEVLTGVVTGEFRLIGEEAELLMEKINDFINENKYNIKSDLDEIVNTLSNKVPIREKKEGFCIKSSFGRKCKYNEFMCAFDMCPNHCTTYFFADITYKRFLDKLSIVEFNKKNNFIAEAELEINKLKRLVKTYFIYELEELEREIGIKGEHEILEKHPNLEYVVMNLSEIREEIKPWSKN